MSGSSFHDSYYIFLFSLISAGCHQRSFIQTIMIIAQLIKNNLISAMSVYPPPFFHCGFLSVWFFMQISVPSNAQSSHPRRSGQSPQFFWDIHAAFNKFVPARNGAMSVDALNAAVPFTVNTFLFLLQGAPCGGCLQGNFTGVRFTKPEKARRLPYSVFHEISVDITAVRMPAVESVPCAAQ